MLCAQTAYKCAYGGTYWKWYDVEEGLLAETDDPKASPKLCSDTCDNDCSNGDLECKNDTKDDDGGMFGDNFWIGLGVGVVVGYFFPAQAGLIATGGMIGSMFIDDPETQQLLLGFGAGMMVGGAVGSYGSNTAKGRDWWGAGEGSEWIDSWGAKTPAVAQPVAPTAGTPPNGAGGVAGTPPNGAIAKTPMSKLTAATPTVAGNSGTANTPAGGAVGGKTALEIKLGARTEGTSETPTPYVPEGVPKPGDIT